MKKESSLFCRQCGAKIKSKDQKFCVSCGFRIELSEETPKTVFCVQCGTENKPEAAFCMSCGTPVSKSKAAETQTAAQPDINWDAQEQKQPSQKKPISKKAIILPVCIVAIVVIAFGAFTLRDSSRTTPFTEYLSLVGNDYEELYSDAYDIAQVSEYTDYYYAATTDISFMDMDGTGCYYFYHTEDEETQLSLAESGIENDTVQGFSWIYDASVYNLDDVCAAFESIYGDSSYHDTYPVGSNISFVFPDYSINVTQIESYCWENVEGGYDLELLFFSTSEIDVIVANWPAHPDVEGSYEDVVSALEIAIENRDVSAYESLVYESDALSVSDSFTDTMADVLSNEEIDQIDCSIGETTKISTYASLYLESNHLITVSDLERIESLYLVNMDITLYQDESIIFEASCEIDIAYVDDEWKIIGMFFNERFSDTLLVELAKQYYEYIHGSVPPIVDISHYDGDNVVIHLYETNGGATATWDWYTIDPYTCEGTDFWGNEIRLYDFL